LCLCLMGLLIDLENKNKLTTDQKPFMPPVRQYIKSFVNKHETDNLQDAMFSFAIMKLQEFWNFCIKDARHSHGDSRFFSDISLAFNRKEYLAYLLGADVISALSSVILNCKKRVLVTLDDFDTIFDTFRRESKDLEITERAKFELNWLRSFLLLVFSIKDSNCKDKQFFSSLDFCITIPKDRYTEIESTERDGYRYNNRTCHILWSGIELCQMLLKRLEKMTGYKSNESALPNEQLNEVCEKQFKALPKDVTFIFNDKRITIPLFIYVLRHTFWRPRDILLYYSSLLAAVFAMKGREVKISDVIIRRIVSEMTYQIIKTEFINEYETTMPNIQQMINSFFGAKQVMAYEELTKYLTAAKFTLSAMPERHLSIVDKIEFLYDIGFLGIILPDPQMDSLNMTCNAAFYFNEGASVLRTAKKQHFSDVKFAIHPIFRENLQLVHSENDLLLNFTWNYLYDNHTIRAAAGNQF